MLLFSTVLDINSKMTRESFMDLIVEWNANTPHDENRIPGFVWNGEKNYRWGNENLWLAVKDYPQQSTIAVRFEKRTEDGVVWDTDYIMNFRNMRLAIRLDRSYTEDALSTNGKFSAPHFITLLINKGYLKADGELPIQYKPICINEENLGLIANLINGNKHYKYPVVYVSRTYRNESPVDVDLLAKRLKGIAHVLFEEDKSTSLMLKDMCDSKNEYLGAVGIYYPNQIIPERRFLYRRDAGHDDFMLERIISTVLQYSNSQMVDNLFTWQGVNNALLLDSVEVQNQARQKAEIAWKDAEQRAADIAENLSEEEERIRLKVYKELKAEFDDLLLIADEDAQKLKEQITELTNANESLRFENEGLRAKISSSDSIPLLMSGSEYDFYQGEIKDLILYTLSEALKSMPEDSRRHDVVEDIINNNDYQGLTEKRIDELKRLLKTYDGMPARLKQDLEACGFEILDDGKHYKLLYYGDARYSEIMSKTPSDWRTGKISAMKLIRVAY